jgi:hypothetical protein
MAVLTGQVLPMEELNLPSGVGTPRLSSVRSVRRSGGGQMSIPLGQFKILNEGTSNEDFQTLAKAIEQVIENVTAQAKINSAVVTRLLALEQKMHAITKNGPRRASSNKH